MKKLNFLIKMFSLVLTFVLSGFFSDLQAQVFISEDAALVKLNSKLAQLEQISPATLTFANGVKVVGDELVITRKEYYSMILRALEAKDQFGNFTSSTRSAYEATRDAFNNRVGTSSADPTSTGSPIAWLHNEALKLLTN